MEWVTLEGFMEERAFNQGIGQVEKSWRMGVGEIFWVEGTSGARAGGLGGRGLQGLSGVSQTWTGVRPRGGLYWTVRGLEIRALAPYHSSGSLAKPVQRFGPDWGQGLLYTWLIQD